MSWVTRCPSCATVFRVAEDQLRVSDGFVRCGRCDSVFNAQEHLFDLESGAPAAPSSPPSAPSPPESPQAPPAEPAWERDARAAAWVESEAAGLQDPVTEPGAEPPPTGLEPSPYEPALGADAEWGTSSASEGRAPPDPALRMRELLGDARPLGTAEPGPIDRPGPFASLDRPTPQRRRLRFVLPLSMALFGLGLPLQWAWIERDLLRAQWPAAEALWQRLCDGCEPVALRRLEGLVVVTSSLQPTPQGQAFQLKVRVENRGTWPLALPWLDLQLSDAQNRVLLRRGLSPADLGQSALRLEGGTGVDLQATFQLEGRLAGYEVGLFHP